MELVEFTMAVLVPVLVEVEAEVTLAAPLVMLVEVEAEDLVELVALVLVALGEELVHPDQLMIQTMLEVQAEEEAVMHTGEVMAKVQAEEEAGAISLLKLSMIL